MWAEIELILRQATRQIAEHVANFLPGVVVSVVLILITVIVAVVVRFLLVRTLRGLDFDRRADRWGFAPVLARPAAGTASQTVARVTFWMILLLGLLLSLTALDASMPSRLALSVFWYIPHLVAAAIILAVGAVAARFLSHSVLIGAVNMHMQSARLMSLAVKWLVLLVAVAMALDHLGIGRSILLLAFGIFFGGVILAAALAVGLGAKDAVSRAIDRQSKEPSRVEDRFDHV
jgi:hypothetical protein